MARHPSSGRVRASLVSEGHAGRRDSGDAFLPDPTGGRSCVPDDLAEILAEEFLSSATAAHPMTGSVDDPLELEMSGLVGVSGD